jgi:hypothetical protein
MDLSRKMSMFTRKSLARIMIPPALGVVLLATNGCGSSKSPTLEPDGGEKIKQARINAYGASGTAPTRAVPGSGVGSGSQADARQRNQQSGR